jgi:hypothetical protein
MTAEFIPSPSEIRAAVRAMNPESEYGHDPDDYKDYRAEVWAEKESAQEDSPEKKRADKQEGKRLARDDRKKRRADMLRWMSSGEAQRDADARDGTKANPGKARSHWKSYWVRKEAKDLLLAGKTIHEVMASFGIPQREKKVERFLAKLLGELQNTMSRGTNKAKRK